MEKNYFKKKINQLIIFDNLRISKLIEMFQYSFIGTFFVLLIMSLLSLIKDNLIFDKITNDDGIISIFCKISLEVFIVSIIVFYIRKLIMIFPSIPTLFNKSFKSFTTMDYTFNVCIVYIVLALFTDLQENISVIRNRIINNHDFNLF
tara:strand:+ start:573 stop:1016 length:444 start_codon:yes stop_codon:yes gene_type:complete